MAMFVVLWIIVSILVLSVLTSAPTGEVRMSSMIRSDCPCLSAARLGLGWSR